MKKPARNIGAKAFAWYREPLTLGIATLVLLIAGVNIATRLADAEKAGQQLVWQNPTLTELSSAVVLLLILPLLFEFFERLPVNRQNWLRQLPTYVVASLVFSAVHVFLMVMIRKLFWPLLFDGRYQFFGDILAESLYEYRKDATTFILFLVLFIFSRQLRQARAVQGAAESVTLKSGATTILLPPGDFLYARSAGNYAEITSLSGTQLARITLADLEKRLRASACDAVRIHRSCLVNRTAITETTPITGGDLMVKLRNGERLRASRRYKDKLETPQSILGGGQP